MTEQQRRTRGPRPKGSPETKRAWLINSKGVPTLHEFSHYEEIKIRSEHVPGAPWTEAWGLVFRCTVTNSTRRWGNQ